ncbi:MAG: hypothetical protein L6Q26_04210 [Anaerolineales bacterium]|nr:hypothetical protein [Anaerolineales bacterium]NUQ83405.1 hypothetical protein [Anaerolineales bacterium]
MMRRKTTKLPDDILTLETRLAGTLKPIQPSSDLVQRLRDRLRFPAREEIVSRLDWRRLFLVFGGVMSALLLVITVARAFFHLVGRRNM